jgi:hypothetical protein
MDNPQMTYDLRNAENACRRGTSGTDSFFNDLNGAQRLNDLNGLNF